MAGLLERESELAAIGAAAEAARAGHGGVLVIEGAAGIGKSSLLAAACGAAGEMRVLRARGVPLEQAYAFGTVRALFEPLRASPSWAVVTGDAAALALPALDVSAAFAGPGEEARHAALHGLTWLAANLAAEQPLLIAVDDAHWADPASLRWLAHLARRIDDLPVLILLAVRSGEPPSDAALLDELRGSLSIRLTPLSLSSSSALVRARVAGAEDAVCRACFDATGGNPFLVDALSASVAAGAPIERFGPEAVTRDVARRLDRLPPGAREVALALAILGPGAAPRHVAALADVDRQCAAEAADALRAAELLAPGARLEFAHPILAAAVAAELGPGQTALWHRRAWRLLHADGAEPERQALHLLGAEPEGDPEAVATLREAARAAAARGASESATAYLRRALAEPPDASAKPAVLLECGLALAAHRNREAPELLHEAIALITDPGRRAEAALHAAQALALAALYDDVIELSLTALADTGDASPETVSRLEAEMVGLGMTRASASADCVARIERARRDPPRVELWRVNAAGYDTFAGAPAHEALEQLHAPGLAGERNSLVGTVVLGLMLIYNDDLEAALTHADALLAVARPRGWASLVANGNFLRAMTTLRAGRAGEALDDARASYEFKAAVGAPPDSLAWAAAPFADALLERGSLDAADAVLQRLGVDALDPGVLTRPILLESRARLRLAQQRPREALDDAREAAANWALRDANGPGVVGWRLCAVEALVALGRRDEAAALAGEQLAWAERHGAATPIAAALRAVALAAPPDEAIPTLERAVTIARAAPAFAPRRDDAAGNDTAGGDLAAPGNGVAGPAAAGNGALTAPGEAVASSLGRLEHVRALVDLGAALRRRGRLEAAREPLKEALHRADRDGATRLAARARAELRAAGGRPRRAALSGRDALTAAERRVAALAAEGRTNREIAQELFVTQRTVETHLTHTFAKLDIASRDALAAALWPSAPVPA